MPHKLARPRLLDGAHLTLIADVARQLIPRGHQHVELFFTGLRPGEKLHENLLGEGEAATGRYTSQRDRATRSAEADFTRRLPPAFRLADPRLR